MAALAIKRGLSTSWKHQRHATPAPTTAPSSSNFWAARNVCQTVVVAHRCMHQSPGKNVPSAIRLKIRFQKGQQDLLCYTHSRTEPPACISGSMICEWYTSLGARKMRKSLELWKNLGLLKDAPKNCSNL